MLTTDGILSIVASVLYGCLLVLYIIRQKYSSWTPYLAIIAFCILRVIAFSIRAYLASENGSTTSSDLRTAESALTSLGVVTILTVVGRLFRSILSREYRTKPRGVFRFRLQFLRMSSAIMFLLFCMIVAGFFFSVRTSGDWATQAGLLLKKISPCILLAMGLVYLGMAIYLWVQFPIYCNSDEAEGGRRTENEKAFKLTLKVMVLLCIGLAYKVVCVFVPLASTLTPVYFVFSPFLEIWALLILSDDLKQLFRGYETDSGYMIVAH